MQSVTTILICQYPLPYNKIASWTTMYNHYLRSGAHPFDIIVCPEGDEEVEGVQYSYITQVGAIDKIKNKFDNKSRFNGYFDALNAVLKKDEKYIIQVIDHSGFIIPLNEFITDNYSRNNFYIQYYYQGFDILYKDERAQPFLNGIDEMFFLTALAYEHYKNYYDALTMRCGVMHNATNSKQFYRLNKGAKDVEKSDLNITAKLVFIWCSQDRPKKGLHLILDIWKRIFTSETEMQLLIVGVEKEITQPGVRVIGRVPNHILPQYYQVSDFYLFPSLWKEGFGIVLAEALKCGCYCIASNQGGIPEVLGHGKYGKIIEHPNFIDEWVTTINESITEYKANNYDNPYYTKDFETLYDINVWQEKMNSKIAEAKLNIS